MSVIYCRFFTAVTAAVILVLMAGPAMAIGRSTSQKDKMEAESVAWSMVLLPDTQRYTHIEGGMEVFRSQTQWIVDNREEHQIRMVLHLGDITDHNSPDQWKNAREALGILDGHVPYALATGNHDYGYMGMANVRETIFNEYFKPEDNPLNDPAKGGTIGGVYKPGELDNVYHTFRAGGHDYLVIALEWGPRDGAVEWAGEVVRAHPDHRAVLVTHAYLYSDNTRYDWEKYERQQNWNPYSYGTVDDPDGTNDGEDLWQKLVGRYPNFILAVNGHVLNDGLGYLVSENAAGRTVHQMLFNTQFEPHGGNGWLRILEFQPDGVTVNVKTYSPYLNIWRTDELNEFSFRLDGWD